MYETLTQSKALQRTSRLQVPKEARHRTGSPIYLLLMAASRRCLEIRGLGWPSLDHSGPKASTYLYYAVDEVNPDPMEVNREHVCIQP